MRRNAQGVREHLFLAWEQANFDPTEFFGILAQMTRTAAIEDQDESSKISADAARKAFEHVLKGGYGSLTHREARALWEKYLT